ncbi:MAG TPA: DUF1697 domain-containing protein [Pyrinomonadaceae bacterium]|nr:DUF1697 domain-containing protein [Pyrinomonadaceae bacterium]
MKYVAFLRAINVGGHIVKMDHLRSLFESLGFANVETFIASGNVIFDSKTRSIAALEKKIEKQLQAGLGYEVKTFIRTLDEIADVIRDESFNTTELEAPGNILYIGFMSATSEGAAIKKLSSLVDDVNDFRLREREVFWLRRTKVGVSQYSGGIIEKTLKTPITFRNSTTVKKILAKYLR